jgi:uncharacterized protein (DUF1330 family)
VAVLIGSTPTAVAFLAFVRRIGVAVALARISKVGWPVRTKRVRSGHPNLHSGSLRSIRMSAYIIADVDIHDPVAYEPYRVMAAAAIAKHGGRYLARGGEVEVREGTWQPRRTVIVEFENFAAAKAFYESDDYAPALALRTSAATTNLVIVDGFTPPT